MLGPAAVQARFNQGARDARAQAMAWGLPAGALRAARLVRRTRSGRLAYADDYLVLAKSERARVYAHAPSRGLRKVWSWVPGARARVGEHSARGRRGD